MTVTDDQFKVLCALVHLAEVPQHCGLTAAECVGALVDLETAEEQLEEGHAGTRPTAGAEQARRLLRMYPQPLTTRAAK